MIGIPPGYILIAKVGAVAALAIGVYLTGHHHGANAVQADWDRSKAQFIDAQSKLILEHAREMEALRQKQNATNIQVSLDHQGALDAIQRKHDADIAVMQRIGLRIPRTVCSSIGPVAEANGPTGRDADPAATIALPEPITRNLLEFAADADRTTEIARACQSWIIKNGFYNVQ